MGYRCPRATCLWCGQADQVLDLRLASTQRRTCVMTGRSAPLQPFQMRLTAVKHVEDHPMSINAKTNRVPATFILVTMIAVTLPVGFAYGIGVGRYEWPPAAYLR